MTKAGEVAVRKRVEDDRGLHPVLDVTDRYQGAVLMNAYAAP
ncbi:MAG: hypothetical protein ABJA34_04820 [Pseudonocardiales bacterium]